MGKSFSIIVALSLSIFLSIQTYAMSYTGKISLSDTPKVENSNKNIKAANLIEKYVEKYKQEIIDLQTVYITGDDLIVAQLLEDADTMIFSLRKIQTNKVEQEDAEGVMRSVLANIKEKNTFVKSYFQKKIEEHQKKEKAELGKYFLAAKKLNSTLSQIITRFSSTLKEKDSLSENDKQIIYHLIELEKQQKRLEHLDALKIESTRALKEILIDILKSIKTEIRDIKRLI